MSRNGNDSSSSLSFSNSSSSSDESDVPEHMGLAPFAWDPTEKLKQANKKLQELELPSEETRPGSKLTFNETVAIKSSSSASSRSGSPDKISEKSENSEKSSDSDTESRILKLENKINKKKAEKEKSEQSNKSEQNTKPQSTKSDQPSDTSSKPRSTLLQNKKVPKKAQFQKSSSYTDDFETENSSKRSNSVSSYNKNYTHSSSRNSRPVSAPASKTKMSSGGKPLWNPDNPPETPHDLPAYMRPKSTGNLLNRNKSRGAKMGQSQFMQGHHAKNKQDFPHINSAYQMPQEQRRAASKRNQLKKEREREEQLAVEEEEKTQVQTAHEVWVAWYETRYAQEKEEKMEVREKNRKERRDRVDMENMRENALTEGGLDYATWCKAKEKRVKEERKVKESEENKKNDSTSEINQTPLEKMKDNDRAFRRWLRKSNRRKKDEDKLDREKERLRRIELRREARAQKALAAIRAAQDVALKNRTFVF